MNQLKRVFLLVLVASSLSYCSFDKADEVVPEEPVELTTCDSLAVTFTDDIDPILVANCKFQGCHLSPSGAPYVMEPFADFQTWTQNNSERFLAAIKHTGSINMPLGGDKLPDSSITKLECWIEAGSPDN